ncbi:conserved uncharacterized protein [Ustilago hordei]|uniref:Conserved uncharacterized protein n=1 Tax=Ustilago hordei TaxID=120017 RepID=I2FXS6_USTHO|nr:conserved uncharacterized protein [Ustilago hordei]
MAKWGMEDNGPVKEFLGISINQDRAQKRMSLNLSAYIKVMMKKHIRSGDICTWVSGQLEITCPKCVVLSAMEVEFIAASEAAREALFFSYLLRDLEVETTQPVLHTDSQGCIQTPGITLSEFTYRMEI